MLTRMLQGKHKNVELKEKGKNVALFFFVALSGKLGLLRFRAAITFFFGITAFFVPKPKST
jgi:hypothetical protein